jgi:hypothetical protein
MEQILGRNDRRLMSALLTVLLVPLFWFLGRDLVVYPGERLSIRILIRIVFILAAGSLLVAVRMVRSAEGHSRVVLTVAIAAVVLHLTITQLQFQGPYLPLRVPLMLLMFMYGALPNSFMRQILPPLFFTAFLIAYRTLWLTSDAAGDLGTDLVVLLVVNAIGVVMVHRRVRLESEIVVRLQEEQKAVLTAQQALAELQTLHGIIPICSHCRQVSTDVGDWKELERYVLENTEARFSHTICPPCFEVHYPSFTLAG